MKRCGYEQRQSLQSPPKPTRLGRRLWVNKSLSGHAVAVRRAGTRKTAQSSARFRGGGRSGQAAFKGCCWRLLSLSPEAMNDQDQPKGFVRSFAAAVCSGPVAYLPELARVSGPLFPSECMCSRLRAIHLCLSRR